ncbi:MAG: hydrogenase maturation protease [Candidatus Omnitrophica bacterium]|nr:hydrogenase maturation protease [Candidatus Omnitrophota bacterium]
MHSEIIKELEVLLKNDCLILGVGNTLRGDDGFGSLLAEELKGKISNEVMNAGSAPENYLGKIAKINPATLLIIDTADFSGIPGEIKLVRKEELLKVNYISTHNISLELLCNFLKENRADLNIALLAAQPESMQLGTSLSEPLQKAFNILKEKFIQIGS